MENSIKYSIDSLKTIYAVIVALAISQVLRIIIQGDTINDYWSNFKLYAPGFLSFFLLIVPFFQGMNRHFSFCYLEKETKIIDWALLIDFLIFTIEASLLFILADSIKFGIQSFIFIGLVLFVDIIWALVSHLIHYRNLDNSVKRWSIINVITLIFGTIIYLSENVFIGKDKEYVLLLLMIGRTFADYRSSWFFYFPILKK